MGMRETSSCEVTELTTAALGLPRMSTYLHRSIKVCMKVCKQVTGHSLSDRSSTPTHRKTDLIEHMISI